jgi:transposase-like protein
VTIALTTLLDDAKCYDVLRELHWPDGVRCPHCRSAQVSKQGRDSTQPARRRYRCTECGRHFDDLTGTIFAGRHQGLAVWMGCLYLMGLNLSNRQIAQELGLNEDDAQRMTEQLRAGIVANVAQPQLSGTVECDEVYVVAGHKGHPEAAKKRGAKGAAGD